MNREIKFRAWDIEENEMLSDVSIQDDTWDMLNEFLKYKRDELIFSQFTGLFDKNGVEIYEKDLVDDGNGMGIGIVEFIDSAYRVNYKNGFAKWFFDYLKNERVHIEVVGNTYENPELLINK